MGNERAVSPRYETNRPMQKWFPQFGALSQNVTRRWQPGKRNFRLRGERLARPVKEVWSILIMARVHIKEIEGL
jgi:hypothetical protein